MVKRKIKELNGGEILARPLLTQDYQVILQVDAVLKKDYIKKLEELGIREVWVRSDPLDAAEISILKEEINTFVKEKVQDILEKHTYRNNHELKQLSKMAERIIVNILDEERMTERVFDIRERSTDIYEHSVNICSMAILTALKLNLEKEKIRDIGVGCLLHDIGIRYSTIDFRKKDVESLNPQEMTEYRKHPIFGYSDLMDEDWISETSKNIVLSHHERLDGSGFPLHKKDIPLECRIVCVCDTFDGMICGIIKKNAKVYEAVEYLKSMRGTRFDAKVVDTFLQFTAVYPSGTKVITNEGELALVISQNKDFQDRPVLRILKDKDGNEVEGEQIKDMVKVHNIFIEKVLD